MNPSPPTFPLWLILLLLPAIRDMAGDLELANSWKKRIAEGSLIGPEIYAAGWSPADALKTATINPALFLGIQDKYGSIKAGKFASMLLTSSNPLKDINNLHTVRMVINKGKIFTEADRKKLLEEVKSFFDKIDYE